jgi:hypothetical protein
MKLGVLGLAGLLLLTGCSSSPSIEAQTKLVEYEKCLDNARDQLNSVTGSSTRENLFTGGQGTNYQYQNMKNFETHLALCESFKP